MIWGKKQARHQINCQNLCQTQQFSDYRAHYKNLKIKIINYLKISLFALIGTIIFLFSFEKNELNSKENEFGVKDINGNVVSYLQPSLLSAINESLIKEGRSDDAKQLHQLYDFNTGYLKSIKEMDSGSLNLSVPSVISLDSASITSPDTILTKRLKSGWQPQGVFAYAHIEKLGDQGPFTQCNALWTQNPDPYVGTTMRSLRLEEISLQTSPDLLNTRPTIYFSLMKPDGTWWAYATWGQWSGDRGYSHAKIGIKMWITTSGWHVYYLNHNEKSGWNHPWQYDGAPAYEYGRRIEAFAFQILQF